MSRHYRSTTATQCIPKPPCTPRTHEDARKRLSLNDYRTRLFNEASPALRESHTQQLESTPLLFLNPATGSALPYTPYKKDKRECLVKGTLRRVFSKSRRSERPSSDIKSSTLAAQAFFVPGFGPHPRHESELVAAQSNSSTPVGSETSSEKSSFKSSPPAPKRSGKPKRRSIGPTSQPPIISSRRFGSLQPTDNRMEMQEVGPLPDDSVGSGFTPKLKQSISNMYRDQDSESRPIIERTDSGIKNLNARASFPPLEPSSSFNDEDHRLVTFPVYGSTMDDDTSVENRFAHPAIPALNQRISPVEQNLSSEAELHPLDIQAPSMLRTTESSYSLSTPRVVPRISRARTPVSGRNGGSPIRRKGGQTADQGQAHHKAGDEMGPETAPEMSPEMGPGMGSDENVNDRMDPEASRFAAEHTAEHIRSDSLSVEHMEEPTVDGINENRLYWEADTDQPPGDMRVFHLRSSNLKRTDRFRFGPTLRIAHDAHDIIMGEPPSASSVIPSARTAAMNMINDATVRAANGISLARPSASSTAKRLSRPTTASAAREMQSRLSIQARNNAHRPSPSFSRAPPVPPQGPLAPPRSRLAATSNSIATGRRAPNAPDVNRSRPATAGPAANPRRSSNIPSATHTHRVSSNIPTHSAPPAAQLPIRTSKTTTTIKKGFRNFASTLLPSRRRVVDAPVQVDSVGPVSYNELQDGENITIVHEEKIYVDPARQGAGNVNAEATGNIEDRVVSGDGNDGLAAPREENQRQATEYHAVVANVNARTAAAGAPPLANQAPRIHGQQNRGSSRQPNPPPPAPAPRHVGSAQQLNQLPQALQQPQFMVMDLTRLTNDLNIAQSVIASAVRSLNKIADHQDRARLVALIQELGTTIEVIRNVHVGAMAMADYHQRLVTHLFQAGATLTLGTANVNTMAQNMVAQQQQPAGPPAQ